MDRGSRDRGGWLSSRHILEASVDFRAWLADVISGIADHPARQLGELLPWNLTHQTTEAAAAA
jgi:hypothetical protein